VKSEQLPNIGQGITRNQVVQLIADGAISTPAFAEGKMVPVAILDTTQRPDLDLLFRSHAHVPPGDALTQWVGLNESFNSVGLVVKFIRPSELKFVVQFDLEKHALLIDQAIFSSCIFLQSGKPGDRLANTYYSRVSKRIFVEIGAGGFESKWEEIWTKMLYKKFKLHGYGFLERRRLAKRYIAITRENFRKFQVETNSQTE
jgi:hypothetical protein